MLTKTIQIDGKDVVFKASAAVPRLYRIKFHRDLFTDLQEIMKSVDKKGEKADKEESEILPDDLSMLEQIAYIMAWHADPKNVTEDIVEWLEQFETFSVYQVLPAILELWKMNELTKSEPKKN